MPQPIQVEARRHLLGHQPDLPTRNTAPVRPRNSEDSWNPGEKETRRQILHHLPAEIDCAARFALSLPEQR